MSLALWSAAQMSHMWQSCGPSFQHGGGSGMLWGSCSELMEDGWS